MFQDAITLLIWKLQANNMAPEDPIGTYISKAVDQLQMLMQEIDAPAVRMVLFFLCILNFIILAIAF